MKTNEYGLVALDLVRPADGLNAGDVAGFTPERAKQLIESGAARFHGEPAAAAEDEPTEQQDEAAGAERPKRGVRRGG
mgnify:FL=1